MNELDDSGRREKPEKLDSKMRSPFTAGMDVSYVSFVFYTVRLAYHLNVTCCRTAPPRAAVRALLRDGLARIAGCTQSTLGYASGTAENSLGNSITWISPVR